ncbi:DUF6227 family protein [Streptomyces ovatisporus]|uniref:DUF6227 family protein n=1 Tax=Streptomyces ovatisporus TaxID=1128682 RepID=A0ABV9A9T5_9ACTN
MEGPTPAVHVQEVMARALNPFDISDAVLGRLEDAVACHVELHGWRQRKSPAPSLHCSSYRHVFLLRDGSLLPLWELRYDSVDGDRVLYEVYEDPASLARSERRVQEAPRETPAGGRYGGRPGGFDPDGDAEGDAGTGTYGDAGGAVYGQPLDLQLPADFRFGRRTYSGTDSPDHARRLLRRAENADRPGEDVRRLLATACGHQILPVPRPQELAQEWQVWCSLYEHAFLLADGSELSLYELEHDRTRDGGLVCEVYLEESFADEAALRVARGDC